MLAQIHPVLDAQALAAQNLIQVVVTTEAPFDSNGVALLIPEQTDSVELRFPSGKRLIIVLSAGDEEILVEDLLSGDLIIGGDTGREAILTAIRA